MYERAIRTIIPNKSSYFKSFLLKKIGSKKAENNDAVAIHSNTELFGNTILQRSLKDYNGQTDIKFGTDGWRALIAKDYTVNNVVRVTIAVSQF